MITISAVLAVALASAPVQGPPQWPAFTRTFQAYADSEGIVGASVAYVQDGRIQARYDAGYADRARAVRVDEQTLYHWGSITKSLTAIAIMQLRDRGRLSLDDRITKWVPELRLVHDPFGMMDSITIRMLLSHTAGFQNGTWPYGNGATWEPFEPSTWNQLVGMMPYQTLHFRPGSQYGYSNPGFIYLARVIEQLTGDPWDAYVQKNIFAPLGLSRSYFRGTPYYLAAHRSHNYDVVRDSATRALRTRDNGADFDPGITTPNGGWNAPLEDLARYMGFLTNTGESRANYEVVLQRSSLAEMWQPVAPMTQGYEAAAQQWMGLSFFLLGSSEQRLIGHTGSQAGFRAFYYFNPRTGAGVLAAFNTTNQAAPATAAYQRMHAAALALLR